MSQTRTQILQSIQQAIDSDWHNWKKLSYIRSRIQGLLDQETRPLVQTPPAAGTERTAAAILFQRSWCHIE